MNLRFFILLSSLLGAAKGQDFIIADFNTSEGDFSVALDYVNAPLACANFIQLAGKGDDILETPDGVPLVNQVGHSNQLYQSTAESDAQRLPLTVQFLAETATTPAQYGIFQSNTYLGGVEILSGPGFHADVSGEDRIRLSVLSFDPVRYRITLRYPRQWIDARDQTLREAPMYSVIPINRVQSGSRFFAGSMTRSLLELPGYYFQHENLASTPFNSPFILAMDSLSENRNGSRFFITTAVDRSLNGRHTAIGTVLQGSGRTVVQNIANSLTNADQEPDTAMFIFGITFRRNGLTAQAFFEGFQQTFMPGRIDTLDLAIERRGSQFSLVTPARPSSLVSLYSSTDLVTFLGGAIEGQSPLVDAATETDLTQTIAFAPKLFVKGFAASVPTWPSAEVELAGAQFSMRVDSEGDAGLLTLNFAETEEGLIGSYLINTLIQQTLADGEVVNLQSVGSGTFAATYDFSAGPYEGVFNFTNVTGPLNVDQVTLLLVSSPNANNPSVAESTLVRRFRARTTDPELTFLSYGGIYQKLR